MLSFDDIFVRLYINDIPTNYFINGNNKGVYSDNTHQLMTPSVDKADYINYHLRINGKDKEFGYHRLVALTFLDPPDDILKTEVDHIDCDKGHNQYTNLEWVTHAENVRRSFQKGCHQNMKRGEQNNKCKYSDASVLYALSLLEHGISVENVSNETGLSIRYVYALVRGHARPDVSLNYNINRDVVLKHPIAKKATQEEIYAVWKLKLTGKYTMENVSKLTHIPFHKVRLIWYYKNVDLKMIH